MRVKFRELLPRLKKCGVCSFFLIKNWDRRVVAVELFRLTFSPCEKTSAWKGENRLFCIKNETTNPKKQPS